MATVPSVAIDGGTTDAELVEAFARYQRGRGLSRNTVDRRTGTLTSLLRAIAPTGFEDVTATQLELWLGTFEKASTRHSYRSDLRTFYAWAVARGLLASNPTVLLDPIRVPKRLPRPAGPEATAAMFLGSERERLMVALGLLAGLRVAEIAGLYGEDIDLDSDPPMLTVRDGKGGKDRLIPVHPILGDLLAEAPRRGPVIPNRSGRAMHPKTVGKAIRNHLRVCGIEASPHQLRHAFGTEAARRSGGDVVTVASLMGHSSTNTTMGYIGWAGQSAKVVASMFGGALLTAPKSDELAARRTRRRA